MQLILQMLNVKRGGETGSSGVREHDIENGKLDSSFSELLAPDLATESANPPLLEIGDQQLGSADLSKKLPLHGFEDVTPNGERNLPALPAAVTLGSTIANGNTIPPAGSSKSTSVLVVPTRTTSLDAANSTPRTNLSDPNLGIEKVRHANSPLTANTQDRQIPSTTPRASASVAPANGSSPDHLADNPPTEQPTIETETAQKPKAKVGVDASVSQYPVGMGSAEIGDGARSDLANAPKSEILRTENARVELTPPVVSDNEESDRTFQSTSTKKHEPNPDQAPKVRVYNPVHGENRLPGDAIKKANVPSRIKAVEHDESLNGQLGKVGVTSAPSHMARADRQRDQMRQSAEPRRVEGHPRLLRTDVQAVTLVKPVTAIFTEPTVTAQSGIQQFGIMGPREFIGSGTEGSILAGISDGVEVRATAEQSTNRATETQPRPVIAQVVQASKFLADGTVEVRLSPEELGRVKLAMVPGENGMTVHVMAERPETLDLLRRNIDMFASDLHDQGFGDLSFSFGQDHQMVRVSDEFSLDEEDKTDANDALPVGGPQQLQTLSVGRLDIRM